MNNYSRAMFQKFDGLHKYLEVIVEALMQLVIVNSHFICP